MCMGEVQFSGCVWVRYSSVGVYGCGTVQWVCIGEVQFSGCV